MKILLCLILGHDWNYKDLMQKTNAKRGVYEYTRTCTCKTCNKQKVPVNFNLQF